MKSNLKPHQIALILASVTAVIAWVVPGLSLALLPLQYLNTHLHELCHALVAAATGGQVEHIVVSANGSGVTPVAGGSAVLTASAGYVGSSIIGGLFVIGGRTEIVARSTLRLVAVVLAVSLLIWVRGDTVGIGSAVFWIVVLAVLSQWLHGIPLLFACQFLGVELAMASFQSFLVLLKISAYTNLQSDATIMAGLTGLPALFWASTWCLISLVTVWLTVRSAWKLNSPRRSG